MVIGKKFYTFGDISSILTWKVLYLVFFEVDNLAQILTIVCLRQYFNNCMQNLLKMHIYKEFPLSSWCHKVALATSLLAHFLPFNIYTSFAYGFWEKDMEIDWQHRQRLMGEISPIMRTQLYPEWLMHTEWRGAKIIFMLPSLNSVNVSRQGRTSSTIREDLRTFIILRPPAHAMTSY